MLLRLTAVLLLALAAPAAAQTPPGPPVGAAEPSASPRMTAAVEQVETTGAALEAMMDEVEPLAAAVRADASLPAADKNARLRALIAERQAVLDAFGNALAELIAVQAEEEGATPEAAAASAATVRGIVLGALVQALMTGEDPREMNIELDGN